MHPKEGEIRSLIDHQLPENAQKRLTEHLAGCPACQARLDEMQSRSQRIAASLSGLPGPSETGSRPISPGAAYARFERRVNQPDQKEKPSMSSRIFNRIPRFAWVTLVIVAVLAIALAFEPVRAVANSFLGLFRVEQVRLVRVDPAALEEKVGSSSQLEAMLSDSVQFKSRGEMQETDSAEQASQLAGFDLRLPSGLAEQPHFIVQPGGSMTFLVDLELVKAVLSDLDRSDIQLPDELDGATVDVEMPTGVAANFGECEMPAKPEVVDPDEPPMEVDLPECITLMQMPSPTISAPPDLNLAQIGEAYLQLLGMSAKEAAIFARSVDWTTTFVIPVPRYGADYYEVEVDGVPATLVLQPYQDRYGLMWIKDGMLYALSGPGGTADALSVAASLK